jgi:trans-aconitate methyltransferase
MNNWKAVWNRRSSTGRGLDAIIKLDGFDQGAGRIEVDDWRKYSVHIAKRLGVKHGASIYEVGCGAGAFLYALREQYSIAVGGIDYAAGLIAAASDAMPDGHFKEGDANTLDVATNYDFVISNGVFHYFSLEYATEVLERMINKARIAVAIMEIPDMATKEESEALRRDIMSHEEYEKKYKGLEHTYYPRGWFKEQAKAHELSVEIFDGCVPNYAQNQFRFGCIIRK